MEELTERPEPDVLGPKRSESLGSFPEATTLFCVTLENSCCGNKRLN